MTSPPEGPSFVRRHCVGEDGPSRGSAGTHASRGRLLRPCWDPKCDDSFGDHGMTRVGRRRASAWPRKQPSGLARGLSVALERWGVQLVLSGEQGRKCYSVLLLPAFAASRRGRYRTKKYLQIRAIQEAGATGLEPATSGVTGRRSNQLSYAPVGGPQYDKGNPIATSVATFGRRQGFNGRKRCSWLAPNPAVGMGQRGSTAGTLEAGPRRS
jgi:hypothetical protein